MAEPTTAQAPDDHMNGTGSATSLGLWDSISIIVGIVVGVSIFRVSPDIFSFMGGPWAGLAVWLVGGVLSLIGALCYAELATTYPKMGGDYVYLTRAYGSPIGFLFGWGRLSVIQTGSIGMMSYIFAEYAVRFFAISAEYTVWLACACVAGVTLINFLGIAVGKTAQNILTGAKILGLLGILVAGFAGRQGSGAFSVAPSTNGAFPSTNVGLALIFVLLAYGGWNDAAYVASETRNPKRNIPLSLLLGVSAIAALYMLVNVAYLLGLGYEGLRGSTAPAADVLERVIGERGSRGMSLLIMLAVLGAVNGMVLTGARVHVAMGREHRLFAALGRWNPKKHAPFCALFVQAAITLAMIVGVGTEAGRNIIDHALTGIGLAALPWAEYYGGFNTLVSGTAPVFWLFFLLTGISLLVLRFKDRALERPFRTPLFPLVPLVFCATCVYMLRSSILYAKNLSLFGLVPLALGIPLYFISRHMRPADGEVKQQ